MQRIEPGASRSRRRNPRGEGGRLRDELIDAASDLMAEHGSADAATIRAVARAAGVSAPSVYLHFADRDALVQAVVEQRFHDLTDAVEAAIAGAGAEAGATERLIAGCRGYVDYGLTHPGHYRVLFDTPIRSFADETASAATVAFGTLVDGVAAAQAAGEATPGDAFTLAATVWTAMHGMVFLRLTNPAFAWPPIAIMLDVALTGVLGLRPAPRSPGRRSAARG